MKQVITLGRLRRTWVLSTLLLCVGYLLFGKTLAYVGIPPIYLGEFALLSGLLLCVRGKVLNPLFNSAVAWLLVLYIGWGVMRSVPYLTTYGVDTLRDSILWGYAFFALLVAAFVIRYNLLVKILTFYFRATPKIIWILLGSILTGFILGDHMPTFGANNVGWISVKPGDISVTLAGIAAFMNLEIGQYLGISRTRTQETFIYAAWAATAFIVTSVNRGGMLAIAAAFLVTNLFGVRAKFMRQLYIIAITLLILTPTIPAVALSTGRTISVAQIATNIMSIGSDPGKGDLGGTKAWRLLWWTKIISYTFNGPYFLTGKGYGINLAMEDGFIVTLNDEGNSPLRSPHNASMTQLARGGVPGLALWLTLIMTYFISLVRAYLRARRRNQMFWANLNLWLLAYGVAFFINMSFDVSLEGPQGGIPFWSLMGLGIAALYTQKKLPNQPIANVLLPLQGIRQRNPICSSVLYCDELIS
jgi:hypothetical protein